MLGPGGQPIPVPHSLASSWKEGPMACAGCSVYPGWLFVYAAIVTMVP
jgi:hypothetical protein